MPFDAPPQPPRREEPFGHDQIGEIVDQIGRQMQRDIGKPLSTETYRVIWNTVCDKVGTPELRFTGWSDVE